MNRKKLTEAVFRALKPVKEEEEEIEDIEVDVEDEVEIEEPTGAVVQSDSVARIQASLVDAIDAAQELGDEKLVTQIGNTITFLTRSQVRGAEAAVDETIIQENPQMQAAMDFMKAMNPDVDDTKLKKSAQSFVDAVYVPDALKREGLNKTKSSRYSRLAEKVVSRIRESRK